MLSEKEAIDLVKKCYKEGKNLTGIEAYLQHSVKDWNVKELKRLDFSSNKIVVGSKVLTIAEKLSVQKYGEYEKCNLTFAFGKDLKAIHSDLKVAIDQLDKLRLVQAAVILNNLDEGMVRMLENRIPAAIDLICLFLTYDDEDTSHYHPELNKQKYDDISQEGYAMEDFFTLACNLSIGYVEIYEQTSRTISEKLQELSKVTGESEEK